MSKPKRKNNKVHSATRKAKPADKYYARFGLSVSSGRMTPQRGGDQ